MSPNWSDGKTIVRFVNRKFAKEILYHGKELRNNPNFKSIYVNNSFSKEFAYINYKIRMAQKSKNIFRYRVKNGVTLIQKTESDEFLQVTHRNDLVKLGLEVN